MSEPLNPENNEQNNPWQKQQVPLQDVVISNSWALQSILEYLEEKEPGARDRIWQIYQYLQQQAEQNQQNVAQDVPEDNDASE